jgi:hypothetical protein
MAAEQFTVTRDRLSEIIGTNINAPHMTPVLEAVRDFDVSGMWVPQGKNSLDDALDAARNAAIVLVGDDTDRAVGPAGFDQPSMRRLFQRAEHVAVISSAPPEHVYAGMATLAALARQFVVIVETRPEQEIAWVEFIQAANPQLPILLVTVEAGHA